MVRVLTDAETCLFIQMIANTFAVTMPALMWAKNGTRDGTSFGWAIVNLLIVIGIFGPKGFGMGATLVPTIPYWSHPVFTVAMVFFVAFSIGSLVMLARFPKKEQLPSGKKPIW